MSVEHQYRVALSLGSLDVCILLVLVVGIEVNQRTVLVSLLVLDESLVLLVREVLAFCVLEQGEVLGTVIERLVGQHTVVDEHLEVVPLLLIVLAVSLEDAAEAVCHLLGDVCGNLLHILVALQVRTAYVKRNVW